MVELIPVLSDNYAYLIVCEETEQAAVVDPADPDVVWSRVQARGVDLRAIWNTHHHWDHTAGNEVLQSRCDLAVVGHRTDRGRIAGLSVPVDDGDVVELGALRGTILHTPGHTRGGIVYLVGDALFTGDALFGAGCGRLFEGDPPTLYHSLNVRLAGLDDETKVYCGHEYTQKNLSFALTVEPGNRDLQERVKRVESQRAQGQPLVPSTLGEERKTNPFLRCDSPELIEGLKRRFPSEPLDKPEQVFGGLRRLRDRF